MHKIYIGVDNGVTGTIAWVSNLHPAGFVETPVKSEQNYTREKKNVTRIDTKALEALLQELLEKTDTAPDECVAVIERPMVNPMRFMASCSALRALEATLIVLENLGIPRMYTDSRAWQKSLLPQGCKGAPELKRASEDIGLRLFPCLDKTIKKHKDADALLIAEWARRSNL